MNRRTSTTLLVSALLCLAPASVWANGWAHVETSSKISFWGAAIGCVVGLVLAMLRRTRAGGVFGWTICGGLVLGLGGTILSVMARADFFFPNNASLALAIAIGAALAAGIGGAILAAMAIGIRSSLRPKDSSEKPPPPA
jgi:hypothetical protein